MILCVNILRKGVIKIRRDAGDIIDRLSIAKLKIERIGRKENEKEFDYFNSGLKELKKKHSKYDWDQFLKHLFLINGFIWDLESDLRKGMLDKKLQEVGRRAIQIRKFNSLRINFKNIINKMVKEGFQDLKKDHISQFPQNCDYVSNCKKYLECYKKGKYIYYKTLKCPFRSITK